MSGTLLFTRHLLDRGLSLERLGQTRAATRVLSRLAGFRDLPEDLTEETHFHLAELHLKRGELKKARRRLAAAIAFSPDNAQYHFLMGSAVERDESCDPSQALCHYRQCTQLDPSHPAYWCALGLLALQVGENSEGLRALRRAQEMAPDNPEILSQVVQGLHDEGELAEARKLLQTALFRNPRDQHFRALWTEHQFQALYAEQQESKRSHRHWGQDGPDILPFTRPADKHEPTTTGAKRIRRDPPFGVPAPKGRRPTTGRQTKSKRRLG